MNRRLKNELYLSNREIGNFIHNAQLAICEIIEDKYVPVIYSYKTDLVALLQESKLTKEMLVAVLLSAAWDIFNGGDKVD